MSGPSMEKPLTSPEAPKPDGSSTEPNPTAKRANRLTLWLVITGTLLAFVIVVAVVSLTAAAKHVAPVCPDIKIETMTYTDTASGKLIDDTTVVDGAMGVTVEGTISGLDPTSDCSSL